jgi:type VI secretion system secreted protein VgrG
MFEVKAGQHSFIGGAKVDYSLPTFYENICKPCLLNAAKFGMAFVDK